MAADVEDTPPDPDTEPRGSDDPQQNVISLWRARMVWVTTKTSRYPAKHTENAIAILRYHPAWEGRIRFDSFAARIVVSDPPWHPSNRDTVSDDGEHEWGDTDSVRLSSWIMREAQLDLSPGQCSAAVEVAAHANAFHPVRSYFDALEWDQSPRLATFASTYLGASQTDYAALVMRWWMISAVARTYQPGCKADYVLILEGLQGKRKSTALRALASPQWFSDTPIDLESKDAFMATQGKIIVELPELDSLRRSDVSRAKAFFSSPIDRYRPPYGRHEITRPRQCVFAGTVNPIGGGYLLDPTGGRRYWPIACEGTIDLEGIKRDRDAIWAEAVHWYREGAIWHPDTPEEHAMCAIEQEERGDVDEWEAKIEAHLSRRVALDTSIGELLEDALGIEPGKWSRGDQIRAGVCLGKLGWLRYRTQVSHSRSWRYRKSG